CCYKIRSPGCSPNEGGKTEPAMGPIVVFVPQHEIVVVLHVANGLLPVKAIGVIRGIEGALLCPELCGPIQTGPEVQGKPLGQIQGKPNIPEDPVFVMAAQSFVEGTVWIISIGRGKDQPLSVRSQGGPVHIVEATFKIFG